MTKDNIGEYVAFIDSVVKSYVPNPINYPDLFKLVTTYQVYSHSKSCRKYKNEKCRYHFGKCFTDHTIISIPLDSNLPEDVKNNILNERDRILRNVKEYTDNNLNPKKRNILNPLKENYEKVQNIANILKELNLTEDQCYDALSISNDSDFQIHLKRQPNACFINNFFEEGLQAWQANIDIQLVLNHYKAVTYMCAYFSKAVDETSEAMKQAVKDATNGKKSDFDRMKAIARAYATKRECSVQEAVYLVMPEIWLRKTFPKVLFLNSNMPEKRYKIFQNKEEIDELPEDSTDIFECNILDRYIDRPGKNFMAGTYRAIDVMCFAEFLS